MLFNNRNTFNWNARCWPILVLKVVDTWFREIRGLISLISLVCSEHQLTAWLMLWVDSRSYCSCIVKTSNQQSCNFATWHLLTMPIKRIFSMREGIYRLYNGSRSQDQSMAVFFSLGGSDGFYSVILRHKVNFMLLIFF